MNFPIDSVFGLFPAPNLSSHLFHCTCPFYSLYSAFWGYSRPCSTLPENCSTTSFLTEEGKLPSHPTRQGRNEDNKQMQRAPPIRGQSTRWEEQRLQRLISSIFGFMKVFAVTLSFGAGNTLGSCQVWARNVGGWASSMWAALMAEYPRLGPPHDLVIQWAKQGSSISFLGSSHFRQRKEQSCNSKEGNWLLSKEWILHIFNNMPLIMS